MGALLVLAVVVRIYLGLHTALDGDESAEALTAVRILTGHLVLMESDGRYLGPLDSYVLAPFVLLLGPTLLAVRVCFALVGGAYVAAIYGLARRVWPQGIRPLAAAAIAGFFPLFALTYGVKARTYGLMLPIEAALLLGIIALAWPRSPAGPGRWLVTGVGAGIAVWHHPLMLVVVLAGVGALALRAPALGWARTSRGAAIGCVGAVVGYSPWLAYNLRHHFSSIRHLHAPAVAYSQPAAGGTVKFFSTALPIFLGSRVGTCGPQVVSPLLADGLLLALVGTACWPRRELPEGFRHRLLPRITPSHLLLGVGLLGVVAVTVGLFNALFCEPRYSMPLAVPLVFAATLGLARWWNSAAGKGAVVALVLGFALVAATTVRASLSDDPRLVSTPTAQGHPDLVAAARVLDAERPEAVWAEFSLARPLQYLDADHLVVGEYGGYVGFPEAQRLALAATHPSWLFLSGDPVAASLEAACRRRGITYQRVSPASGLVLYDRLSAPVRPDDLGIQTQRVDQVF